ncbi:MAG: DUF3047 domain-containing protein [Deltaproteobacteria bacterium]|nr:DUF3047 domain-containing protein [Deltaproteobacteria bacterium]
MTLPATADERFDERHRRLLDCLANDRPPAIADWKLLTLPGNRPPWTDTGVDVRQGDQLTLLATGKIFLSEALGSEALGLWGSPRFHLWGRIGERGTIWNGTRDTFTLTAVTGGRLFLGIYQGEWASPQGDLATPVALYAAGGGAIDALVVRWNGEAMRGLESLARLAPTDRLLESELARLRAPVCPPEGWRHLWFLGESEIFAPCEAAGRPAIRVHADSDVGIIQKPIDFPLAPDTRLSWRWKVDELPSSEAEDSMRTHDYLSLALEFDDGKDLTWYWSAALPAGTHYACPLPTWNARETHIVVRSGTGELGRWTAETRNVFEDHRTAIGGAPPRRIVAAWLIAVSIFRHGRGRAEFADVVLESGGARYQVV